MAYNFGWIPAMVSQLAVLMAIFASWSVLTARTLGPYAALVFFGVLVSAVKVQFAGDLVDSTPLLLVCFIALTLEPPVGSSTVRPQHFFRRLAGREVS
jgi:hypothetical protein